MKTSAGQQLGKTPKHTSQWQFTVNASASAFSPCYSNQKQSKNVQFHPALPPRANDTSVCSHICITRHDLNWLICLHCMKGIVRTPADLNTWGETKLNGEKDAWDGGVLFPLYLRDYPARLFLITDIPHDTLDALKGGIHRHLSHGVNLKVAALWMSAPTHTDLFKCHLTLLGSCETGRTKGFRAEVREKKMEAAEGLSSRSRWHIINEAQRGFI